MRCPQILTGPWNVLTFATNVLSAEQYQYRRITGRWLGCLKNSRVRLFRSLIHTFRHTNQPLSLM